MAATYWSKGSDKTPLYSDWKVYFTTYGAAKDKNHDDAGSVSTSSLSSSDGESVMSSPSNEEQQQAKPEEVSFAVHRNMIGPRSDYFTKSFTSKEASDSYSSVINLPSNISRKAFGSLLDAFEILLDYCYNNNPANEFDFSNSKLTTKNAVAMFCLCNYLQMDEEVCLKVREFITNDLNQDTVASYYQDVKDLRNCACDSTTILRKDINDDTPKNSVLLNVTPIHEMVAYLCFNFPQSLSPPSGLSLIADLVLWLSIGSLLATGKGTAEPISNDSERSKSIDEDSKIWSVNLTYFFDHNHSYMKNSFRLLTNEKVLPVVSEKVALRLLEHEREHGLGAGPSDESVKEQTKSTGNVDGANLDTFFDTTAKSSDAGDVDELDSVIDDDNGLEQSKCRTTSLQHRCIKALADSNWFGEENDVNKLRGTGKLSEMTSPYVLEELLIESVSGERKLGRKNRVLKEEIQIEKQLRREENEKNQLQINKLKVDLVKEQSDYQRLTEVLEDEAKKRDDAERKLISFDLKLEEEKKKLRRENAKLENKLEDEKKRSFSLDLRYRSLEQARHKTETDREMLELTCKETITRLEAMSSQEEWWNNMCGAMTPLILMLSTMSDRRECDKIKGMLQQVVEDPSSYERNFLLKNVNEDGEDVTIVLTTTLTKNDDDETIDEMQQCRTARSGRSNDDDTINDDYSKN